MTWNDDNVQWGAEQQWGFYATNLTSAPLKAQGSWRPTSCSQGLSIGPFNLENSNSVEAFFVTNAIVEYHKKDLRKSKPYQMTNWSND